MQNNIGEARRRYSDKVGKFTQEDAAEYFGVALSTYKKWEQGQGMLNGEQLKAIAEKYGTTSDYLLRRVDYAVVEIPEEDPATLDERELVMLYRNMDGRHRSLLMENARSFAALSGKSEEGDAESFERAGIVV